MGFGSLLTLPQILSGCNNKDDNYINNKCLPVKDIKVDLWQCDAKGNYSKYNNQLDGDFDTSNIADGVLQRV